MFNTKKWTAMIFFPRFTRFVCLFVSFNLKRIHWFLFHGIHLVIIRKLNMYDTHKMFNWRHIQQSITISFVFFRSRIYSFHITTNWRSNIVYTHLLVQNYMQLEMLLHVPWSNHFFVFDWLNNVLISVHGGIDLMTGYVCEFPFST